VPAPALTQDPVIEFTRKHHKRFKEGENVFVELVPLLKDRTLLITVASIDGKLKVNLIPAKAKEGEEQALTTPLSFTGSAEELDAELGSHLASYVHSHLELRNTLAEVKAEMDAAAKAARQKAKATPPTPKSDSAVKKEEPLSPSGVGTEATPSLFAPQPQSTAPAPAAKEEGGKTTP
jgi:PRTRC genetic system protein E